MAELNGTRSFEPVTDLVPRGSYKEELVMWLQSQVSDFWKNQQCLVSIRHDLWIFFESPLQVSGYIYPESSHE